MEERSLFAELKRRNVYKALAPLHGDPRFEGLAEKILPAAQFGVVTK